MTSIASAVLLTALAGTAWAQEVDGDPCSGEPMEGEADAGGSEGEAVSEPPPEASDAGTVDGAPPMILPQGKLAVHVGIGINLSADAVAKPLTINPDVWYGVMPKLEAGLAHSSAAITGFWADSALGGGLCVTGEESNCAKLYNGPVGILARFAVMEGNLDVAADGGIVLRTLDPMALAVKAGVRGRWSSGKIMAMFAPNIMIGLTEREGGNKEYLSIPVAVGYAVSPKLHAGVQTGIQGPLDGFGDFNLVPLSLGAMFQVNDKITAGGAFSLLNIAGSNSSADYRGLVLFAEWHN